MKTDNTNKARQEFMSLSKIAYGYDLDPSWASDKWLSEPSSLEFIQLWESLHNLNFNKEEYIKLCTYALSRGASPSVLELQNLANCKSIFVDKEYRGEIYMHKDIAIDFASWASPAFRTFCLLNLQDPKVSSCSSFKSEEDFVISAKTLAHYTQKAALEKYKEESKNADKLFDYSYYVNSDVNDVV